MLNEIIKKDYRNFLNLNFLNQFLRCHNGFIAGGCFKNIFLGEPFKDIDIFFESLSDFEKAVVTFEDNPDFTFHYKNKKVTAFKHIKTGYIVELCQKTFGSPEEILKQFDFTVSKFAYAKDKIIVDEFDNDCEKTYQVYLHADFFEHLHRKKLVIDDKILFPASTFDRLTRYVGYGFKPCYGTKVKLVKAINSMDRNSLDINKSLYDGLD